MAMRQLAAVFVVIVLLGACSDDGSESADTSADTPPTNETSPSTGGSEAGGSGLPDDVCSLVSEDEVGELLPTAVTGEMEDQFLCAYSPVTGTVGVDSVAVDLFVQDVAATGCDLSLEVGGFIDAEPIDGIGSSAYWKDDGTPQLAVCLDEQAVVVVTVYPSSDFTDAEPVARSVADLAVAQL